MSILHGMRNKYINHLSVYLVNLLLLVFWKMLLCEKDFILHVDH